MSDGEISRLYHEATGFGSGRPPRPGFPGFVPSDPQNRPHPFKRYPGAPVRDLPADLPPGGAPAVAALSGRVPAGQTGVDLEFLARLLFFATGVTRRTVVQDLDIWFRTAPSAGNRHPVETYVAAGAVQGLEPGLYHFAPDVFGLEELSPGDCRPAMAGAAAASEVAAAPLVLVLTGIPWRTAWKYGERGWRHVYWDAGTALANLLTVAEAYGVRARVLLGFVDSALCRRLGIEDTAEFPIAMVVVGGPGEATEAEAEACAPPGLAAVPLSPAPLEFPLISRVQQAGELATAEQVTAWRATARLGSPTARDGAEPPASASEEPIESVILRRGSTRRMRQEVLPAELLEWGMAVATRRLPADAVPAGATLLSHQLDVHAVQGVESGLYHWAGGRAEPYRTVPEAAVRRLSRYLCRNQALGGDSAFTAFMCADLDRVFEAYGDRGYRVAQLEAGVAAGRLQLAAFALGYGATGLTFTDDDVSAAFGSGAACMLAVSVGSPAYRSRPGGPPGRPTRVRI
ncbi:SagB/ThcOx family dehydrogenase [Actinoallomurus liliacearum]|uniref:SagB/ThcOx family dehydrogenase n=1 Tax=Actinoallomurus liliacearum TaxID=1080073 RepID=A0ABP8TVH3_9ACTN